MFKLLILFAFALQCNSASGEAEQNMEYVHELIFDEISSIKRKVWIDISTEIRSLSRKIETIVTQQNSSACSCSVEKNTPKINEQVLEVNYAPLIKAFKEEKLKSRETEHGLKTALSMVSDMEKELEIFRVHAENLESKVKGQTETREKSIEKVKHLQVSVDEVEVAYRMLRKDLSFINSTCCTAEEKATKRVLGPSFTSDWFLMRAQDPDQVQKIIHHNLGVLPYKVEVQIRATSGPNSGWTFHGDAAFQSDDDYGGVYGGIVYLYNETHVVLVAPAKGNNKDAGVLINTGSADSFRTGNNHQTALEAYVRIKVWVPSDFPEPDYKTEWLPLDITNQSLSYYEMEHGLTGYPGFINIQIRCNSSTHYLISEGVGATMMHRRYSNAGGVVYGFNDKNVRLWTGYLESTSDNGYYRLFLGTDGWGGSSTATYGLNGIMGEFRILAWDHVFDMEEKVERNTRFPEWSAFERVSTDADLLSFYVEAADGPNKGYRFRGYGNSQSIDAPYGGAVYAFNSAGEFRIWNPNTTTNGYLIHVHSPYGNGKNVQASNNAHFVASLLKTKLS